MLLSAHEIIPSILSLEEIHARPTSDIRTASINAKVDLVLRRKIASSFAKIAVSRDDRLAVQDLLGSLRFMIHNTAFIYSLGLDIEDFPSQQMFRRFRTLSDPTQIIRALKKLKTPEGVSFEDVLFDGTGTEESQRDQLLRRLLDKSLEVTYSIEWVVAQIVKGRVKGGMLYEQAQYIGGVPVGEYVVEKILDALIGRSTSVETEEDFLSQASLKRGPKNGTLFYKIFRSATQRKKKVDALDEGDKKIGKGNFSWKSKSRFVSSQVGRINRTMLDLIKKAIEEDKSANFGDQEAFDAVLESVSEAYSDLVNAVSKERTQEDTEEVRATLSETRAEYKKGGASDEEKSDYAHAILDLVTTTQVTLEDLRFLLDHLSLISDNAGNQKRLREIIYDKLFRRGALKPNELVYLDGGYDSETLKREVSQRVRSLKAKINSPFDVTDIESANDKADDIYRILSEISGVLGSSPEEIYTLRDASYYVLSGKPFTRTIAPLMEGVLNQIEGYWIDQEGLDEELEEEKQDILYHIDENLRDAISNTIPSKRRGKTLIPESKVSGHPLSRYSISDYTPVTKGGTTDAVTPIAGMALKKVSDLSASDLNVANTIQRNLTTEARQVVGESTKKLKRLLKVISSFNLLASSGRVDDERLEDVYEILRESNFDELLEEVIEEDTLKEKILDFLDQDLSRVKKSVVTRQAKSIISSFEESVEGQKESLREAYRESLSVSISSLMRDAVKENVGDPARRLGSDYFPHTAVADRTSRQVLKALGWDTFVAKTLLDVDKMSDPVSEKVLTAIRAEVAKHSGSDEIFKAICKKKGFEVSYDAEGVVTPDKNKKGKKLTFRNAKTIMNEASKNLRTSNSYFDEAISKSEEEIEETIKTKYEDISRQLDADTIRVFDSFTRNMASGFVQRATEDQAILSEALDEDLMKEITELRSAYIHSTIVTFEDRVKKDLKETYEAEAAQVTKELEARVKELEDTDTEEAKEELDDIESGVHEIQRKRGRKKKEYQESLRDALRLERRERGASKNYRYVPAVEEQEEAIMDSYNRVVEAGISAIVSLESTGVGENLGEGSNILTNVNDLSVANRANSVRKINALRNKYPSENRTFFPVYNKTREPQIDKIIDLIQKDPSSFPSVSEDALQRGLLFSFLKAPYGELTDIVFVDTEGRSYPYPKPNVFSDVGFAVHLQSFFRNLVASVHPTVKTDPQYGDFIKNYKSTPTGLMLLEEDDELAVQVALGNGLKFLDKSLRTKLVDAIKKGSQWQGLFNSTNSITFAPYKNTLNNYKGLLADLNLLMFLASEVVDESDSAQVGVNANTVESLADIYNISEEEIEAIIQADLERESEDL